MRKKLSILAVSVLLFASCNVVKETATSSDVVKITRPCSLKDYPSSTGLLRASSVGVSVSEPTAKKKAAINARGELATSIDVLIKAVNTTFAESIEVDDRESFLGKFNSKITEVVKQKISKSIIVCDELRYNKETKKYSNYVAVELNAADLLKEITAQISSDEEMKARFAEHKYNDTYNAELEMLDQ